jgi:uncharacterized glyoxalase superfamily protein PhnB
MIENRSIPSSVVIPVLGYKDVFVAAEFLSRAFGFRERLQIGDHRIQLVIDGGAVVVAQSNETPAAHSIMIRVDDANAHFEQAKREGARIASEPVDWPYGERQYTAQDPGGHIWTFTQSIADVDPADWGGVLK